MQAFKHSKQLTFGSNVCHSLLCRLKTEMHVYTRQLVGACTTDCFGNPNWFMQNFYHIICNLYLAVNLFSKFQFLEDLFIPRFSILAWPHLVSVCGLIGTLWLE